MVEERLGLETSVARIRYLLERGRVFHSYKRVEEARPLFLEAWEVARRAGQDGYALDAAHMLGIIEPPEEALRWNEKALTLARSSEQPEARRWLGSLLNNMGWSYHDRGEHEKALELFQQALAYREERGLPPAATAAPGEPRPMRQQSRRSSPTGTVCGSAALAVPALAISWRRRWFAD